MEAFPAQAAPVKALVFSVEQSDASKTGPTAGADRRAVFGLLFSHMAYDTMFKFSIQVFLNQEQKGEFS